MTGRNGRLGEKANRAEIKGEGGGGRKQAVQDAG